MENKSTVAMGTVKGICGSDLKCAFHVAIRRCQSQLAPRSPIAIKFDASIKPVFTIAALEWSNLDSFKLNKNFQIKFVNFSSDEGSNL